MSSAENVKSAELSKEADDLLAVIEAAVLSRGFVGLPIPSGLTRLRAWIARTEQRLAVIERAQGVE